MNGRNLCYIDDSVKEFNVADFALTYLGSVADYLPADCDELIVTVASPTVRSMLVDKLVPKGSNFVSYVHPSVVLSAGAKIGKGVIILPYSLVSNDSTIGDFSVVNCFSSVGHDVSIGPYVTISSHVDIMGHCVVNTYVFMGSGSRVLPGKHLGESAVIGAGATAVRSVPGGKTLYSPLSRLL